MSSTVSHSGIGSLGPIGDCNHGLTDLQTLESGQVHHQVNVAEMVPPLLGSAPYVVSDGGNHCNRLAEKLRAQREQARFTDLILSVQGREFPAHRCVLASCSSWFDGKLKVHKCTREHIEIDQCKDYEIFYALMTYCYTGHIVINDSNVAELLNLSHYYGMSKMKSYCCDYLIRNLSVKTLHTTIEQSTKFQLTDLAKQAFIFLQRHFAYLLNNQKAELMEYSYNLLQAFLVDNCWNLPSDQVVKFIVSWVSHDISNREGFFSALLETVRWEAVSREFIEQHITTCSLYSNSAVALHALISMLERIGVNIGLRHSEVYNNVQGLQEIEDDNSLLTMAINTFGFDQDQAEQQIDPDWFLHGESQHIPDTSSNTNQGSNIPQRHERMERYKDSFELDFDQVFDEPPQFLDDRQKSAPPKRYDPKFRALTEANRFKFEDMAQQIQTPVPKVSQYLMHPKQRHISNTLAYEHANQHQRTDLMPDSRSDDLSADFLPNSRVIAQDVSFPSLLVYDALDSHNFMVDGIEDEQPRGQQVSFDRQYDSGNTGLMSNHETDLLHQVHISQKSDAMEPHHASLKTRNVPVHEGMRQIFERDHGDHLSHQNQSQYHQQLHGMCGRQASDPKHNSQSNIFERVFHGDRLFAGNTRHQDYDRPVLMKKPTSNDCKQYHVRPIDRQYVSQHGHPPDAFVPQTRHPSSCDMPPIQRSFERLPHSEGISDSPALVYQHLQTNHHQHTTIDRHREKVGTNGLQPPNRDHLNIRDNEVVEPRDPLHDKQMNSDEERFFSNSNDKNFPQSKTDRSSHVIPDESQPKSPEFHKHHLKFRNNQHVAVQSPEKVLNTHVRPPDLFTPEHEFSEGYEGGAVDLGEDSCAEEIITSSQPQLQSPREGQDLMSSINLACKDPDEILDRHEPARTYETQLLPETMDNRVSLKIRIKTHSEYFKQASASPTFSQNLKELPGSSNSIITDLDDAVYKVEGKKQKASKLQRMSNLQESNVVSQPPPAETSSVVNTQNRHVKKAKLLAEHRKNEFANEKVKMDSDEKTKVKHKHSFSCEKCPFITRSKSRFAMHSNEHSSSMETRLACPMCDTLADSSLLLRLHIKESHKSPPYKCKFCEHSTKKYHQLMIHIQIHWHDKKFECPYPDCTYTSNTVRKLYFHRRTKHLKISFECTICQKKFSSKQSLKVHQVVHDPEPSHIYSCDMCHFSTKYSNHLTSHMKKHSGDVFRCSTCSYSSPKRVHLLAHEKTHTKSKEFVCGICNRGFVEKSHLTRHQKIHLDEMPFACESCQFKTKRKDKLKAHVKRLHEKQ